ncbi:HAD family hydrolase [Paenibacillus montanisoli]|uniref:HAD family hydrolase n=1 Tax=Paenibacillus montanisoli TaxID=2081970 RepID=A0A328U3V7_9BACL|nr:HAD family hydrolase [Paenibacillus montanisoli]RAP76141.1 HAD family hydrolase [Paenibacillus montanisoli]
MQKMKAIIFDLDNTLLDRTRMFGNFATAFLQTHFSHIESTEALYNRILELDRDGYKDRNALFAELIEELPWRETLSHAELAAYYKREYMSNAVLMDRAHELLAYLRRQNYRIGLITNGRNDMQYGKIDRLGLRDAFEFILVSEEAGVKKPDAKIFEMALERLGLLAGECIFIGDHPVNDIEGASSAGMETIWIQVNHPWREELTAKPLHTIRQLGELIELL